MSIRQNQTGTSKDQSISAIFEERVKTLARKPAVQVAGKIYSYAELNQLANRIAHAILLKRGDTTGRIALFFEQGIEAIAAIFGVLKTGNAYVPLDTADPDERIRYILNDCKPGVILTDSCHLESVRLLVQDHCTIIDISQLDNDTGMSNLNMQILADSISCMFYTSGSTGNPKGVCQSQRNLLHFVRSYAGTLGITADDRLTLLYSLSFSASNMDIHSALLNGATLCPYDIRKQGTSSLAQWLRAQSITILHMVPSAFRHLMTGLKKNYTLDKIRAIDLGGEAVFQNDVKLYKEHFTEDTLLLNHFAATEASVIAQLNIGSDESFSEDILPVGSSADGVEIRIINEYNETVPPDETGEIYIHSPFISPGYWNRPELNAQVFSDDKERQGWRIYKTGDLGRLDSEGRLSLIGRSGSRVKIRGYSVDLAEVEAALTSLNVAKELAVICREKPENRLVAFIAGVKTENQDAVGFRKQLDGKLPRYMIPAEIIFLETLPKTSSGKLDRLSMEKMELKECVGPSLNESDEPIDQLEKRVKELFYVILKREKISRNDDFFALGGDSLKFAELHTSIEEHFGLFIGVGEILEDPTIVGIAKLLSDAGSIGKDGLQKFPILVPIRVSGDRLPMFFVHGQLGQAFVSPNFLKVLGDEQPVYAFQAQGLDGVSTPHRSIGKMADDYINEMKRVRPEGPYLIGALCSGSFVAVEIAAKLNDMGDQVAPLLLIDPPFHRKVGTIKYFIRLYKSFKFQMVQSMRIGVGISHNKRRTMIDQIRWKNAKGTIDVRHGNPLLIDAAIRVRHNFKFALLRYRMPSYDGAVRILASKRRILENYSELGLSGDVQKFEVSMLHTDILDVSNQLFSDRLEIYMQDIYSSVEGVGGG